MPSDPPGGGPAPPPAPIRLDTLIAEAIRARVGADRVLLEEFGLPCLDCEARFVETIGEGVTYTGVDPTHVVARLNALPAHPPDPQAT